MAEENKPQDDHLQQELAELFDVEEGGTAHIADISHSTINTILQLESPGISLEGKTEEAETTEEQKQEIPSTKKGKYRIIKEVARGGMGKIVLWEDNNIHRVVATKLMLNKGKKSPQFIQRFLEEGQITGQLEHPNIVPIHEMGLDEKNNIYFTMKYVKGKSLSQLLDELKESEEARQHWTLNRCLQIFLNICYAIDYAHSKNVIHRDLKPENIMLGSFGEVMVMDWGLAKVLSQGQEILTEDSEATLQSEGGYQTISGRVCGTPLYMSPEQAKGKMKEVDHRSDIYSLGTILYEMVTGTTTVDPKDVLIILSNVAQGKIKKIPKIGKLGPIPKELRCIIEKSLSLQREDRYQNVRELIDEIQRYMEGREVLAYQYTLVDKAIKWYRNHRKEVLIVAATLIFLFPFLLVWDHYRAVQDSTHHMRSGNKNIEQVEAQLAVLEKQQNNNGAMDSYQSKQMEEKAKKSFEEIKRMVFDSIQQYREANEIQKDYRFRKLQAEAWFKLFEAASLIENQSWKTTAHRQIKTLLNEEDYKQEYHKKLARYRTFQITTNPAKAAVYLFRFEEFGKWFRLAPFPFDPKNPDIEIINGAYSAEKKENLVLPIDKLETIINDKYQIGTTPINNLELPEGTYAVVCKKEFYAPSRSFIHITRNTPATNKIAIELRKNKAPENFVYIPRSRFLMGGEAVGALAQRWASAGPVYMAKQEVTFQEYAKFLRDITRYSTKFDIFLAQIITEKYKQADNPEQALSEMSHLLNLLLDGPNEKSPFNLLKDAREKLLRQEPLEANIKITNKELKKLLQPLYPANFQWELFEFGIGTTPEFSIDKKYTQALEKSENRSQVPQDLWREFMVYDINLSDQLTVHSSKRYRGWFIADNKNSQLYFVRMEDGSLDVYKEDIHARKSWKEQSPGWKNWPVFGVKRYACQLYALWLSSQQEGIYRLPTEEEWELAARGVDGRIFPWGRIYWKKAAKAIGGYSDIQLNSQIFSQKTHDISPWGGIYDLVGSLGEWTGSVFASKKTGNTYTIKGNIWGLTPEGMKCAFRVGESEHYYHPTLGFRLVRKVED